MNSGTTIGARDDRRRSLIAVLIVAALPAFGQIFVSMDLIKGKGGAAELGSGAGAYTWNIYSCPAVADAKPVPFEMVRMMFHEVGLYSVDQVNDILAKRIEDSAPRRLARAAGVLSIAVGGGVQVKNTLDHSPSQLGTGLSMGGILVSLAPSLLPKVPQYQIHNPVPAVIAGPCSTFEWLAHFGTAAQTLGPRRVDPDAIAAAAAAKP